MGWIQKIGWPRPRRPLRRPGRAERRRNDRQALHRRYDPVGPDRSYAAYAASWDELEWEPVWVFAPPATKPHAQERLAPAVRSPAQWASAGARNSARRMRAGPARVSRSGALLLGLGTAMLGLALAPLLPELASPVRMGLTATAALALFGSFLVLRGGGGSLEHG